MTTTVQENQMTDAVTALGGWVVVLYPSGLAYTEGDPGAGPLELATRSEADELAASVLATAEALGIPGAATEVVRAAAYTAPAAPAPMVTTAPASALSGNHPAPLTRVHRTYAIALGTGRLYLSADDRGRGRAWTAFTDQAAAESAAAELRTHATNWDMTGFTATVVVRAITTKTTDWAPVD
ncbi:hypothetical protein [Nocardia sp. NPDC051750]|uniref:hypothetical protein n=1 Tax=Nocardia sp. NPDC051750 TaxID=3364325 RepID=UPI0037BCBEAF